MTRARDIQDYIKEAEYMVAKHKAILSVFPDTKIAGFMNYISKSVNNKYTKLLFTQSYSGLFVVPYCEIPFTYEGKTEIIRIHSSPRFNRLAYLSYKKEPISRKRIMKFSRMTINFKNNNFKGEMLNSCRAEIMKFIAEHPGFHLDTKHLEPRLKKLLMFI